MTPTAADNTRRDTLLASALILAAVVIAYANSLHGAFVLDDSAIVTKNDTIRSLFSWRVFTTPIPGVPVQGRPLVNLSLAIDYAIDGDHVAVYHITNVMIHAINALLLFALARTTLRRLGDTDLVAPAVIAVLWAVHPLTSAAVDYVSQRTELMASSFYLLVLYCAARAHEAPRPGRWLALAVLACLLGVGCKETIATAPLMVILYDRAFVVPEWRQLLRRRWVYAALFAMWIPAALLILHSGSRAQTVGFSTSPLKYLLTQSFALTTYLKLSFWPHPLIFDYGPYLVGGIAPAWPYVVFIAALLVATVVLLWRRPAAGFLPTAWFLLLMPTTLVPIWTQTIAEHRAYLPLAALVAAVVLGARRALRKVQVPAPSYTAATGALLVAAILCVVTIERNALYRSPDGLWQDVIDHHPYNSRAFKVRGDASRNRGQAAAALGDYDRAIELQKDYADAYINRALVHLKLGQVDEALADADAAIRLKPDNANFYSSRGSVLLAHRDPRRAVADFDQAIRLGGANTGAFYFNRGNAHRALGDLPAARDDYRRAAYLVPNEAAGWQNLGGVRFLLKDVPGALDAYDHAIELSPSSVEYRRARASVRAAAGDHPGAIEDLSAVIELAPKNPEAYAVRAREDYALANYRRAWDDVLACRKLGGQVDPDFLRALVKDSGRSE